MKKTTKEIFPASKGGYICRIITNGVVIAEAWGKRPRDAKANANTAATLNNVKDVWDD